MGAVLDEVVRPDVVGMRRPQTNAGAICEPEAAPFGLLLGNLQPLTSPDPLDPRVADQPASITQQGGDLAVAIGPYCRASSITSAVSRSASSRPRGTLR